MTRQLSRAALAATIAAVACSERPPLGSPDRMAALDLAVTVRRGDPTRACDLFAAAGAGTVLERARLELWLDTLELGPAALAQWQRLLDEALPTDVADRARLGLARALTAAGQSAAAAATLEVVSGAARDEADERLIDLGVDPARRSAARRLATAAPERLRRADRDLERAILPSLSPQEWLERSRGWRRVGRSGEALAELGRLRWPGADDDERLLEMVRAHVDRGSPGRALSVLAARRLGGPDALLIRADAERLRGWQRTPGSGAHSAFASCLADSGRVLAASPPRSARAARALELVLECATESGDLETAIDAWWQLAARSWRDSRREWLGRRLGIELARRGGESVALEHLASSLPTHARSMRFWAAVAAGAAGRDELRRLADAGVADVYASWARELVGTPQLHRKRAAPPVLPAVPPASVRWLVDRGEIEQAVGEWRRLERARRLTAGEALAAAEFTAGLGREHEAIGWLLAGFPELGGVDILRAPANVAAMYLPLRWQPAVESAAREAGIEPWLVAAVARQESLFVAHARSPRGAVGVLQLLPATATGHARALGLGTAPDLTDPTVNLRIGSRELARLIRRFGAVEPALAAYNAGETRVRRWWRAWPEPALLTERVPVPETYNYIRRVSYLADAYRLVYEGHWGTPP